MHKIASDEAPQFTACDSGAIIDQKIRRARQALRYQRG